MERIRRHHTHFVWMYTYVNTKYIYIYVHVYIYICTYVYVYTCIVCTPFPTHKDNNTPCKDKVRQTYRQTDTQIDTQTEELTDVYVHLCCEYLLIYAYDNVYTYTY